MTSNLSKLELSDDDIPISNRNDNNQKILKTKNEDLMWVEKYRPQSLNDVISHTSVISTISQLIKSRKLPHLLFYGPPGTGKTTTILACARKLNGSGGYKAMTLELNASDDRGIDIIRNQIKTFASTQQIFHKGLKLVILDEADSMTSAAQFALRRVIEKYTKNTRFCLICNYVNKIIPALQSRCTKFRFAPLETIDIEVRVREIAQLENANLSEDGLQAICMLANGDMRKALNILQATFTANIGSNVDDLNGEAIIDSDAVYISTGQPKPSQIKSILHFLLNSDFECAFSAILKMQQEFGLALEDILLGLHSLVLKLKMENSTLALLLSQMSDLEHRLTVSTNAQIQMASLVAIFQVVRHSLYQRYQKKMEKK